MSRVEEYLAVPLSGGKLAAASGAANPYRLLLYLACSLVALAINYVLGKELAWDTQNYHLYAGFNALHDRFSQDYFAAGPSSYLVPYAYAPFYALVRTGIPDLAIASLLAVWHSVILWLTFELGLTACPAADARTRFTVGAWAALYTLCNPVLLQQFGSSFADVTTAEFSLAGWLLLAKALNTPRLTLVVFAATLLGIASALKLTNAVHALSAAVLVLFVPLPWRGKIRYGAVYGITLGLTVMLAAAPWSYRLWTEFGNPFFPVFNNLFRSPEFTTGVIHHLRFVPGSLAEGLWRPFAMLDPSSMVHVELIAPDSRYALLVILASTLLVLRLRRLIWPPGATVPLPIAEQDTRVISALGCALVTDWILWLVGSGNSRYFLPAASVAAVLVAVLAHRVVMGNYRRWIALMAAVIGVQLFQVAMIGAPWIRYFSVPWSGGPWFTVTVPERLATEPNLYLTIGTQSNAFVAAYLAKGSGLINFTGSYALGPLGPGGERIAALIRRYGRNIRFLVTGDQLYSDLQHIPNVQDVDGALMRFGLRSDPSDCLQIQVVGLQGNPRIDFANSAPAGSLSSSPETTSLVSCHVIPGPAESAAQIEARRTADIVLDRLEDACPELFQPSRPLTEYRFRSWRRVYINTDITAWVSRGWVKFLNPGTGDGPIFLGRDRDWAQGPLRVSCGRRGGHDYATLLGPAPGPPVGPAG